MDDPSSTLRLKIMENVANWGVRIRDDDELRAKVDGWLLGGTRYLAANYADEITTIITDTGSMLIMEAGGSYGQ